ncbi:MAG: cytochrome C oxidase subunit IV family protein [Thermoanaerobaculia bacterium]
MSGHGVEAIQGEVRRYWIVGLALFLLTIVTVAVSYLDLSAGASVFVALAIACLKGGLVAAVFMHLISERQAIYALLTLTVVFFVVLMWFPMWGRIGSIAVG